MTISMYKASVPIFVQFLTSLSATLDKAAAHAEAKKIDPAVLLNARLFPDMFPLVRQVRAATDHAINACGRLAGVKLPTFANTEASIPRARRKRVAKTIDRQISRIRLSDKTSRLCFRVQRHLPATTSCSEWRRARQAGLHGNAAPALAAGEWGSSPASMPVMADSTSLASSGFST